MQGPLSEQDRAGEPPGMATEAERVTDTLSAIYSHFLVLLQQQSRKVTELDD